MQLSVVSTLYTRHDSTCGSNFTDGRNATRASHSARTPRTLLAKSAKELKDSSIHVGKSYKRAEWWAKITQAKLLKTSPS